MYYAYVWIIPLMEVVYWLYDDIDSCSISAVGAIVENKNPKTYSLHIQLEV